MYCIQLLYIPFAHTLISDAYIHTCIGVVTHIHTQHQVLELGSDSYDRDDEGDNHTTTATITSVYSCCICDKVFPSIEGLHHHSAAKHSQTPSPPPIFGGLNPKISGVEYDLSPTAVPIIGDGLIQTSTTSIGRGVAYECMICGQNYDSPEALATHLTSSLQPRKLQLTYTCNICLKSFQDERALIQHTNYTHTTTDSGTANVTTANTTAKDV